MKIEFQQTTTSPALPYDIIALIIDIVGGDQDKDLLKELALVSHSFLHICSKHLFAEITLSSDSSSFSKKAFIKLLESRPEVVKFIRRLRYQMYGHDLFPSPQSLPIDPDLANNDRTTVLSPILPKSLQTIPHLTFLEIYASNLDWNKLDSSLTSAFLHLMQLPTINHIDLQSIDNFPMNSLFPSVNLLNLDLAQLDDYDRPGQGRRNGYYIVQSEIMPKIRELHTSESLVSTMNLLTAKLHDGQPAFKFVYLRRLSMSIYRMEGRMVFEHFLRNAKLLQRLELSLGVNERSAGLHNVLSLRARTLIYLELSLHLVHFVVSESLPLAGFCTELEAMAGHNILEALAFVIFIETDDTEETVGPIIQDIEKALVKPGWSALRRVCITVISTDMVTDEEGAEMEEDLQSLPQNYLSQLSAAVALEYIVDIWRHRH